MASTALLRSVALVLLVCRTCQSEKGAKRVGSDWDHFVFSQQWPVSVCIDSNETHSHKCEIPWDVSTWTIHGIWPSKGSSEGPSFCNESAKFDPQKLTTILTELEEYWPNLYTDSPLDQFWEHEWDKHGTCAMTLEALDSELKYFTKGIDLGRKFELLSILRNGGIVPKNDVAYPYADIMSTLTNGLGGSPSISCFHDKETLTQYITEIRFCLDTAFNVIVCPHGNNMMPDIVHPRHPPHPSIPHRFINSNAGVVVSMIQQWVSVNDTPASNSDCSHHKLVVYPVMHHK